MTRSLMNGRLRRRDSAQNAGERQERGIQRRRRGESYLSTAPYEGSTGRDVRLGHAPLTVHKRHRVVRHRSSLAFDGLKQYHGIDKLPVTTR